MSNPTHEFGEVSVVLGGLDNVEYGIFIDIALKVSF